MKSIKHLVLFWGVCSVIFTTEACIKEGEYTLPEMPPLLVAMGNPVVGEHLILYVSASSPIYEQDSLSQQLSATAVLSTDNLPLESMSLIETSTGRYFKSKSPVRAGVQYGISVSADGFNSIKSSTIAPENAILRPFVVHNSNMSETLSGGDTTLLRVPFTISVENLPATDSLFAFRLLSRRVLDGPGEPEIEDVAKFAANGNTFANLHETLDQTFVINRKVWANNPDQSLTLDALLVYKKNETKNLSILMEWRTISPEYYQYHLSLSRQGDPSLPFSTPDLVFNNILNGLGNFSAYARKWYEIKVF